VDFFDDFERFDEANWQDQLLWVNNEDQCYVPDGAFGTREVSDGTLKLRVVDLGAPRPCETLDKNGRRHPDTRYVAGRLTSKNRKEFSQGRWTARLRVQHAGRPGMFPAFWLLGARNNEPPVQEADENVCWPLPGSGEIDIFEHYGKGPDVDPDGYATRIIVNLGSCDGGDWQTWERVLHTTLEEYHEYSLEWQGEDLVFGRDGTEVRRIPGVAGDFVEPMFAVLNFAKITDAPMEGEWVMEVDWVRHESMR
jgi:beta-glucanase (GH16 family)